MLQISVEKQQELIGSVSQDSCLVYKHFATLYFVLVFDSSENELAELDLIQDKKTFHKAEASHFDGFCDDLKLHSVQIHLFVEYILLYEHLLNTIKLMFMCTGTSDHCCVTQLS
ncbi:PREDICTED: AP-3 complex subunit sigma [Theobroma cacao]|uniref:AP-3 complex subunit sigma n=1 Tax=Theobroma cacao TaxID=3641 RepID=A0AB32VTR3_THECC|nr:PREDICTED: AP-3 complex subunit sigma [Theobroma cacao]